MALQGREREVARGRAAQLRDTIAPHFLRREKGSVQQTRPGCAPTQVTH